MRFEVLVEGHADTPVVKEVLTRKYGLRQGIDFRIHPHHGKGTLPANPLRQPDPRRRGLLDQLPAKLRGWSTYLDEDTCVLVLIDVDDIPCRDLLRELNAMLDHLEDRRPPNVLFRLAIEETESWFIADPEAIKLAFPRANTKKLPRTPDSIVGAWEHLADALRIDRRSVTGEDKFNWAEKISPHLNLNHPRSPSFRKLLEGIQRKLDA